jgi:aryl-alcohol dehydrogenase-like predicted oxidoreductase
MRSDSIRERPTRLALGTMNFGRRTPERDAHAIVARALERGVVEFDTANAYGDGAAEKILANALGDAPAKIATKVGLRRRGGRPEGLSRSQIVESTEECHDRLRRPIDLLYLHAPDPRVAIEESLEAIARLVERGLVRAWGVSNFASWQVLEAILAARALGLPKPADSQVLENLLVRQIEIEYVPFARKYAIETTVFNALAGGLLSGRHEGREAPAKGSRFDRNRMYLERYWSERFHALVADYASLARAHGRDLVGLAYGFLAALPFVDRILVGAATVAHLDAAIDACAAPIESELMAEVDAIHRRAEGTDARYAR